MSSIKIAGIAAVVLLAAGLVAMVRHGRAQPAEISTFEPENMKDFKKPEPAELKKKIEPFVKAGLVKAPVHETAILAGGCFWGMEEIIRQIPGVLKTTVGYSGGTTANPTYKEICTGGTGHAEAIQVEFDPARLNYEALLDYFFRMHDPTTLNRQHNDVGTQYRSAILYNSEEQKLTAERVKTRWDKSGKFNRPITTEITQATKFYSAEDYHQKYLVKNPGGYTCHVLR